jgi:sugar lactone lactonase YvrE
MNSAGEQQTTIASVELDLDRMRLNEAKCDPAGRFVFGSMTFDEARDAAIYSVDQDGRLITLLDGIGVSNGFEWSEDGRRMWFTDTAVETIYVGDYSRDGHLSNIRTFAKGRKSDGLTRDVDGGFWNGIYDTGRLVHRTSNGVIDLDVDVPAGHVTSVGFGGHDLSTLFIATARETLTEEQLEDLPLTGSIFRVGTATSGYPVRTFGNQS